MRGGAVGTRPDFLRAMAVGARQRTGSTYALSTTGVAGPGQGGESAPVGTVYVGIADAAGSRVSHRQFLGGVILNNYSNIGGA